MSGKNTSACQRSRVREVREEESEWQEHQRLSKEQSERGARESERQEHQRLPEERRERGA